MSLLENDPPTSRNDKNHIDTADEKEKLRHGQEVKVVYKSYRGENEIKESVGVFQNPPHSSDSEIIVHSPEHQSAYNQDGQIVINRDGNVRNPASHTPIFGNVVAILPIN